MGIYISTNLFRPKDLDGIFKLVNEINSITKNNEVVGIELFSEWQSEVFEEFIVTNLEKLKKYNISLHGPYYMTEHSDKKGTLSYKRAKEYFIKTLNLCQELDARYIVYHHNNCKITDKNKSEIIKNSSDNLLELNDLAKDYKAKIVVENAGVISNNNMLFNEIEFIEMAKKINNFILIDIGHAFANKWDLESVITKLSDRIVAYHIHNNDGNNDSHNSIMNGKLDIDKFMNLYRKYTPNADLVIEYGTHCRDNSREIINDIKYILEI